MGYWVGFDVGKAFHWVCVLDEDGGVVFSRRVEATERDLEACREEIDPHPAPPKYPIHYRTPHRAMYQQGRLFTRVRGRAILGTSGRGGYAKLGQWLIMVRG